MGGNNKDQDPKDEDKDQDLDSGGYPSSPGSNETPQQSTTEESPSGRKPKEKDGDAPSGKEGYEPQQGGHQPKGSPYKGEDGDE